MTQVPGIWNHTFLGSARLMLMVGVSTHYCIVRIAHKGIQLVAACATTCENRYVDVP